MPNAELSIVVPTLNEEKTIAGLLDSLRRQQTIQFELIIVDGGSDDATLAVIEQYLEQHRFNASIVHCRPGRALQMNRGAAVASASLILFLHADSGFEDDSLLQTAVVFLTKQQHKLGHDRVAGHFPLRFQRSGSTMSTGYYFFECKTHLNRLDTINGDQGFLLSTRFFQSLGGFDESLGYMEDARLARKIFSAGQWFTLPGVITTSARRFETEGLQRRQILNAFLCNFEHIGLQEFFAAAASAYRNQDKTRRLDLNPFLQLIHKLTTSKGIAQAARWWYRTGSYVASNAWQLAFAVDCRCNFAQGIEAGQGKTPFTGFYDTWLAPIITSPPGRFTAMAAVFVWFYGFWFITSLRRL